MSAAEAEALAEAQPGIATTRIARRRHVVAAACVGAAVLTLPGMLLAFAAADLLNGAGRGVATSDRTLLLLCNGLIAPVFMAVGVYVALQRMRVPRPRRGALVSYPVAVAHLGAVALVAAEVAALTNVAWFVTLVLVGLAAARAATADPRADITAT